MLRTVGRRWGVGVENGKEWSLSILISYALGTHTIRPSTLSWSRRSVFDELTGSDQIRSTTLL